LTFWLEHVDQTAPTIRNLVKTDYLTIDANKSVFDAARLMRDQGLGNVIVTVKGTPMGILTERDVLNKVAAEDLPASRILVRKIMSAPLITVTADIPLTEAVQMMAKLHIRTLFVTDNGKPMGLLNQRAIIGDQFKVARAVSSEEAV
jgi:predicted transcriptional regulator